MGTSSNLYVRIDERVFTLHASYDGYPACAGFHLAETFAAVDAAALTGMARTFRAVERDRLTDQLNLSLTPADLRKAQEIAVKLGGGRWSAASCDQLLRPAVGLFSFSHSGLAPVLACGAGEHAPDYGCDYAYRVDFNAGHLALLSADAADAKAVWSLSFSDLFGCNADTLFQGFGKIEGRTRQKTLDALVAKAKAPTVRARSKQAAAPPRAAFDPGAAEDSFAITFPVEGISYHSLFFADIGLAAAAHLWLRRAAHSHGVIRSVALQSFFYPDAAGQPCCLVRASRGEAESRRRAAADVVAQALGAFAAIPGSSGYQGGVAEEEPKPLDTFEPGLSAELSAHPDFSALDPRAILGLGFEEVAGLWADQIARGVDDAQATTLALLALSSGDVKTVDALNRVRPLATLPRQDELAAAAFRPLRAFDTIASPHGAALLAELRAAAWWPGLLESVSILDSEWLRRTVD